MSATAFPPAVEPAFVSSRPESLWADAWKRLRRNRAAVASAAFLVVLSAVCALAPWVPGIADPSAQDLGLGATGPSAAHWFGTDELGRDVFARTLHGGRISLLVGLIATLVSLLIGVSYGAVSGYAGGRTDEFMMRGVDVLYSLPYIFLFILLLVFFSRSLLMLFVALGLVQWLTMARIVRGQVLSLKNQTFVEAARALGASDGAIIFRHIVPNTLGPVIVYTTLTVPAVILQEAFLSFLGLGVQPPTPSWGLMVSEAKGLMFFDPWLITIPGAALFALVLAINMLGDGLRDVTAPENRG